MFHFRNCIFSGNNPLGIHNGIDGLIKGEIKPIGWSDVTGWIAEVGFHRFKYFHLIYSKICMLFQFWIFRQEKDPINKYEY